MEYVNLGTTGLKVSRICLGCMTYGTSKWREWVLNEAESREYFKQALDLGINFFDTADVYSLGVSEEITGRALHDFAKRDQIILATKVCNPMGEGPNERGLSRKHIMDSIDASLRRLGTDYVDLYQTHRWDKETPIEETMEALNDVVRSGKARYIGASSMYAWQFAKALFTSDLRGWTRFVSMQNHYNLVYRDEPTLLGSGHRLDSVESARARLSRRQSHARQEGRDDSKQDRRFRSQFVLSR
jgi:aryl-alcohol dehydrogenase (NADP+)